MHKYTYIHIYIQLGEGIAFRVADFQQVGRLISPLISGISNGRGKECSHTNFKCLTNDYSSF